MPDPGGRAPRDDCGLRVQRAGINGYLPNRWPAWFTPRLPHVRCPCGRAVPPQPRPDRRGRCPARPHGRDIPVGTFSVIVRGRRPRHLPGRRHLLHRADAHAARTPSTASRPTPASAEEHLTRERIQRPTRARDADRVTCRRTTPTRRAGWRQRPASSLPRRARPPPCRTPRWPSASSRTRRSPASSRGPGATSASAACEPRQGVCAGRRAARRRLGPVRSPAALEPGHRAAAQLPRAHGRRPPRDLAARRPTT